MSETKIKSAKIVKDKHLTANLIEEHGKSLKECDVEIHPDLKQAFENLSTHLAVLCGYTPSEDVKDIKKEQELDFHVRAYSISKDQSGVVITGHHITPNGKAITLNSPLTRFEEAEDTRYIFMDDLRAKLDRCEAEVRKYLFEGKKANEAQQAIEFPEPTQP